MAKEQERKVPGVELNNQQYAIESKLHEGRNEGWSLVGALAQWQSTGMVSQRPWV